MDLRKIKLDLTIALMNKADEQGGILQTATQLMLGYEEVGQFNQYRLLRQSALDKQHTQSTYSIEFENCTLDLSMVANPLANSEVLNGFELR